MPRTARRSAAPDILHSATPATWVAWIANIVNVVGNWEHASNEWDLKLGSVRPFNLNVRKGVGTRFPDSQHN